MNDEASIFGRFYPMFDHAGERTAIYPQASPFGDKRLIVGIIPSFRNDPDDGRGITTTITEDAEEIYPLACDKIRETYEDWDGFTVQKSKDGCKMDNHIGPPWIFADIAVQNNILTIDITEQR